MRPKRSLVDTSTPFLRSGTRGAREPGAYMAARPTQFPNMLGLGHILSEATPEERFEFGLDVFLAGLVGAFQPRRKSM